MSLQSNHQTENECLQYLDEVIDYIPSSTYPSFRGIDEIFNVSIKEVDGEPGIFFDNKSLVQFLKDWQAMKELLSSGSQTEDNYEIWKTIRPSVTKTIHED